MENINTQAVQEAEIPAPLILRKGTGLTRSIDDYPGGIIIPVNKPYRWTSADVIRKIKYAAIRHFNKKNLKVGHAGTLDPLATGVLLVCIGKATKLAEELQSHDKEYIAGISFGATTPSYDLEKEIDARYPHAHITADSILSALKPFLGEQEQIAPLFSAKSVDGVRAYEIARKLWKKQAGSDASGEAGGMKTFDKAAEAIIRASKIRIDELELQKFISEGEKKSCQTTTVTGSAEDRTNTHTVKINVTDNSALLLPEAKIRIVCSKGTYIRAFARDLGEALDSGAHLSSLVRSRSGDFRVGECLSIDDAIGILT